MNLLTQITITGQVRLGYAQLTAEYRFVNLSPGPVSPRYFFPVPEGGQVTGFQCLNPKGQLVRASVCPVAGEPLPESGFRLRQLSPLLYCLQWEAMGQGESCRILLELLLPLVPGGAGARLVFPSGLEPGAETLVYEEGCPVELTLYTGQEYAGVTSPSHAISCTETQTETVVSAALTAGRDLVLDFEEAQRCSFGMVQEQWTESIGVYRIHSQTPEIYRGAEKKQALLLLDSAGVREDRLYALKELFFRVLQALPEGMPVQAALVQAPCLPLLPDYTPAGEDVYQQLFRALAEVSAGERAGALPPLPPVQEQTLVILVSGGKRRPCATPETEVHLFTLGEMAQDPLADFRQRAEYGLHTHFYPEDVSEARVRMAVKRLLRRGTPVQVTPADGAVQELLQLPGDMAADGYLTLVARSTGQLPRGFTLWQEGVQRETLWIQQVQTYSHLPMAEKLYAHTRLGQLELLARRTDPGSVGAIKKKMEEIAVRYGVVSSETMLCLPGSGAQKPAGMPVQFSIFGGGMPRRRTIFGEEGARLSSAEKTALVQSCCGVLCRSIRSDGGIYDSVIPGEQERANQTALAVAALYLQKEKDRAFLPVLEAGERYLDGRLPGGLAGWLYTKRHCLRECRGEILQSLTPAEDGQACSVTAAAEQLIALELSF